MIFIIIALMERHFGDVIMDQDALKTQVYHTGITLGLVLHIMTIPDVSWCANSSLEFLVEIYICTRFTNNFDNFDLILLIESFLR